MHVTMSLFYPRIYCLIKSINTGKKTTFKVLMYDIVETVLDENAAL